MLGTSEKKMFHHFYNGTCLFFTELLSFLCVLLTRIPHVLQHELALELVARSRTLIWLPLPLGGLLVKLAEATNCPPIFVNDYEKTGLVG